MYSDQTACVYSYDITEALSLVTRNLPDFVLKGYMSYESLLDNFLDWAFHSFDFISIENYSMENYNMSVRNWFLEQDAALAKLWHQFSVDWKHAGRQAFIVRRGNMLWLFVLI